MAFDIGSGVDFTSNGEKGTGLCLKKDISFKRRKRVSEWHQEPSKLINLAKKLKPGLSLTHLRQRQQW